MSEYAIWATFCGYVRPITSWALSHISRDIGALISEDTYSRIELRPVVPVTLNLRRCQLTGDMPVSNVLD
jgi:hypothetical protein